MSDHPHKYMIQVNGSHGHHINSQSLLKYDLEQVRTEASMVAEILDQIVIIYSAPTFGTSRWQVLEHVEPPPKKNEDENE